MVSFIKQIADVATPIGTQIIPGVFRGAAGGLITGNPLLAVTGGVLGGLSAAEFEEIFRQELTIEQSRELNFLLVKQGLPTVGKFGQPLRPGGLQDVILRADLDAAREAARATGGNPALGVVAPGPRALPGRPTTSVAKRISLARRDPLVTPSPQRSVGLNLEPPKTAALVPPNSSPARAAFTQEDNMAGFFETLGDSLVANAPSILQGFATGGFSGGLLAAGQSLIAPQLGLPPKVQLANRQAQTVAALGGGPVAVPGPLLGGFAPSPRISPTSPVGLRSLLPTPIQGRLLALGGAGLAAGGSFSQAPSLGGVVSGFGKPAFQTPGGPFPIGPRPPPTVRDVLGGAVGGFGTQATGTFRQVKGGGMSNFVRDECGNIIKYYCSTVPGQGWTPVLDAPKFSQKPRKPFARLNMTSGLFEVMKRRRMNPLNPKALGRAKRRQDDFLDIILPMVRDRKKEQAGKKPKVVARRRRRKAS